MKDLHSHFLPGVDDGSHSMKTTLLMLKSAKEHGVCDIMFTPHYIIDSKYESPKEENLKIFEELKSVADYMGINIYLGNEVYCNANILEVYNEGKIATLNNSRYMLIEIPMYSKMNNVKSIFFELISNDIIPILAHPERYTAYYNDFDFFYDLRKMGVLMQINFPSLVGEYGGHAKKMAKMLLKYNLISFVGSDIHDYKETKYQCVAKAEKIIKKLVGEKKYIEITETNFEKVINNEEI